ncbi:MAG: M23 family metallopeptidase [Spirochaetes bacterium]|nr:M23 family metallopeptidase [Spirochaetota bacterium]
MGVNPFKDSDLQDLQQYIKDTFSDNFGFLIDIIRNKWYNFLKKAKERITIMLIPHSEKKIINFHVPIYIITIILSLIIITVTLTSVAIVNHTSTIKDVTKLQMHGTNSKVQISKYKKEINRLYDIFQRFKPEITYLYSLTNENNVDSLWAKGGVSNPEFENMIADMNSPSLEELNIKEIEHELRTTREILAKIKKFLNERKKVIEHTPSLWPSDGYIVTKFGTQSLYNCDSEFIQGIEIAGFPGAEIRATAPGKIENINWDSSLGLTVTIKHKYGFTTKYSHCQRIVVNKDQEVSKGETIGFIGKTGKTTKHICYYQIEIGTDYVDPLPYLNKLAQ